jgi:hypothetical protein
MHAQIDVLKHERGKYFKFGHEGVDLCV